jgi:beta-fructofuranosidase
MALQLADKWLWDFWFAQDGTDYHVFYLQAPRSLEQEGLRHWNVSIGHAVSQDLCAWEILPDALSPNQTESWDDYTTWTGSVIQHDGLWHFFYTGGKRSEKGLIQRIGLATSSDLIHWHKHSANPLIVTDPQWYELLDLNLWHEQAWRDPWVFRHPETGKFHAFITARCNYGPTEGRGVIGHARSDDLIHWEVLPPLTSPGEFGYMEVPQLVNIHQHYYLLFSAPDSFHSPQYTKRTGQSSLSGTLYMIADNPLGPFRFCAKEYLVGDKVGSLYSSKLIKGPDDNWNVIAFHHFAPNGAFIGELSDPMSVDIDREGNLLVST